MPDLSGKVLVTGASGFLGSHVVAALLERGSDVIALKQMSSDTSRLEYLCPGLSKANTSNADLTNIATLKSVIRNFQPHTIIHCAAYGVNYGEQDANIAYNINVKGTLNLLHSAEGSFAKMFVNIGTSYEYGNQPEGINLNSSFEPCNLYGKSKLEQFRKLQNYDNPNHMKLIHLRPFTMFGPIEGEHKLLPLLVKKLQGGECLDLTPGEQLRNYVYVRDIANYICDLKLKGQNGLEAINLYSRDNLSLRRFANLVAGTFDHTGTLNWKGKPYRKDEIMYNYADISCPILHNPTPINVAIADTIDQSRRFNNI